MGVRDKLIFNSIQKLYASEESEGIDGLQFMSPEPSHSRGMHREGDLDTSDHIQ